jgi:ABC-type Co2+ transport system permease subunit
MGSFTVIVGMHIMEGFLPFKWALYGKISRLV